MKYQRIKAQYDADVANITSREMDKIAAGMSKEETTAMHLDANALTDANLRAIIERQHPLMEGASRAERAAWAEKIKTKVGELGTTTRESRGIKRPDKFIPK